MRGGTMTKPFGTPLGPNTQDVRIYRERNGKKVWVHVGQYDHDLDLYQWAPAPGNGLDKCCYTPSQGDLAYVRCVSLGIDEWAVIRESVKRLELKVRSNGRLYRNTGVRAHEYGREYDTPNGERFLIPLASFRVVDAGTGMTVGMPTLT